MPATLKKAERLSSKKTIGKMFKSGSRSFAVFPLRIVYLETDDSQAAPAAVMVSVSKSRFKHAVDRNRVKRQIREAYRLDKDSLTSALQNSGKHIAVAIIYLANQLLPTPLVRSRMHTAIQIMGERLADNTTQQ